MKVNFNNQSKIFFYFFCPVFLIIALSCTPKAPVKDNIDKDLGAGQYVIPYKVPNRDSIKKTLDRVRDYFYSGTKFRIIDTKTGKEITDFTKPDANADLDNGENGLFSIWSYTQGVTYSGMLMADTATGDKKYSEYPEKCINYFLSKLQYFKQIDSAFGARRNSYKSLLHTGSLDDCGAMGAALIRLYKVNKDPRLKTIIDHIADYITNKQFRLNDGTLARQRPQPESVWADDMYMSVPFLAEMGNFTGDKKYYDDAVKQVIQMSKYLFKLDKEIYDHGVNIHNEYDPEIFWGRANGWCIVSINDLLDVLPENYKGRDQLLKILRTHVKGLTSLQGKDGFWHNLLDKTDSYTETSCTAMFVYGIAHAINSGRIDYTFGPVAQAGWNALETRINAGGQVEGTCWGTTFASENVYYYHRPASVWAPHGYGPVFMAGAEMMKLLNNKDITIQEANRTYHYRLKSQLKNIHD